MNKQKGFEIGNWDYKNSDMHDEKCAMKIQLVWFVLTENDICLRLKTEKIKVWTSFITLYYDSLWARTIDERKHFDQKVWFLLQFDRYLFPVLVMIIPLNKTTSYYRFDMNEDERMSAITINAISGIHRFTSAQITEKVRAINLISKWIVNVLKLGFDTLRH